MSIDSRGHRGTGYLSNVTSTINDKRYTISTVWNARTSEWETSVFRRTFFGMLRPLMCVSAQDEKQARWVHDRVEKIAEQRNPAEWSYAKSKLINGDAYALASDAGFFQKMLQATGENDDE